ncbi:MAG TPA: hypothetical protein ENH25_09255 [candidate division Zixibacteria bacterium]|nr:hypothetical protein [candidate division Zixibacteria bacterium]
MPRKFNTEKMDTSGGRVRRRMRGMMSTKTGKTIGIASLAAPIVGYIINDIQKPNSMIRNLVGKTINRLLESKSEKAEAIDITHEVEVIDDEN